MANNLIKSSMKLHNNKFFYRNYYKSIIYYKKNINWDIFHSSNTVAAAAKKYSTLLVSKTSNCTVNFSKISRQTTRNYSVKKFSKNQEQYDFNYYYDVLKTNETNYKRINYEKLLEIIRFITPQQLAGNEGIFLLKCCTMLPDKTATERKDICEKIWTQILRSFNHDAVVPTPINKEHLLEYINACRQIKYNNINDFKEFLEKFNSQNDQKMYEELLYLSCEFGDIPIGIVNILSAIKERGFQINENIFNALILGHSRNKNLENCQLIVDTMIAADIVPTIRTYKELLCAYIENDDFDKGLAILNDKAKQFSEQQLIDIIKTTVKIENQTINHKKIISTAINLLSEETLNYRYVASDIRNICIELIYLNRYKDAYEIIEMLPIPILEINEDVDFFGRFFIKEMLHRNTNTSDVLEICNQLIKSKRNVRALHTCCEISLKNNYPNSLEYLKYLSQFEPLRPHYFWSLFIHQYRIDGESGVLNVLQHMKKLNVQCDYDTLTNYVLINLPITLKDSRQAIRILNDHNVKMTELITPLIGYLISEQRYQDIINILQLFKAKIETEKLLWPLVLASGNMKANKTYGKIAEIIQLLNNKSINPMYSLSGEYLIELSTRVNDFSNFQMICNAMDKLNTKISLNSYDFIWQQLSNTKDSKIIKTLDQLKNMVNKDISDSMNTPTSKFIESNNTLNNMQHPKNMSVDELECHLIELQSKGMNCRGVLRKLLQQLVRGNRLKRALEIKEICDQQRVDVSPGMLSSVFDLMIKVKDISEAEKTLLKLKKLYPTFIIDDFKIIDYCSLLIENNRMNEIKLILKNQPKNKQRAEKNTQELLKNSWNLLTQVAIWSSKNNTPNNVAKEYLQFLNELGYCDYHNTVLGPIIREHMLKYEIKDAVREFIDISKQYRRTPLQRELLMKLIEISNMTTDDAFNKYDITNDDAKQLLENVISASKFVHGGTNTNMLIVIAVAHSGTENQLRKILIDPSIKLVPETFLRECEYLNTQGNLNVLLKLAKSLRGLGHQLKEHDIYQFILQTYTRDNNYNAALELFETIVGDDEFKLSKKFMDDLVDLMEKNNLEIPTNVKLHVKLY